MLSKTTERVPEHTATDVNKSIRDQTVDKISEVTAGNDIAIEARLKELDSEWDIERLLETNAATIALTGIILGAFWNRKLLILPAAVAGFLLQHALQGWCPPLAVFRRKGIRTQREISNERTALKVSRGDFNVPIDPGNDPKAANHLLKVVER